ncbi:transcription elongation factor GreA [Candidatus Woesebacteria bacterium RBG_16_36_11]|uniref:Transcription elongation factor GreA n=3 Tax=Candidatus Woeseibacteriota TaxID=1752722 RepID=A0A1F7X8A8_9BACT|nr:MAG: transcription elongation factor GreA [Candidatus Woesebacteria bacterium RBG_13_36_22]OGM11267.1 MAG: transcription elongation factor GreA [Candidatus Woesebacteria bacterium RBG_16_36_11]OGM17523.1 MAG: transcription elongation factor GreA [Candidatus Woesebacteria bacterium RBG_19FT_COMBO_37_29]
MAKTQITKEGLEVLQKELDVLLETKRPKLVERLAFARNQGDLSENNDYQTAKEELEFLDGRIAELEEVLKNVVIVQAKNGHKSLVEVGTKVTLKVDGEKQIYFVVGDWEADPKEKKISHTSPLGKALVGKKIGEKIEVEAPAGKLKYEILSIE